MTLTLICSFGESWLFGIMWSHETRRLFVFPIPGIGLMVQIREKETET